MWLRLWPLLLLPGSSNRSETKEVISLDGLSTDSAKLKKMQSDIKWKVQKLKSDMKVYRPELDDAFADDDDGVPHANIPLPAPRRVEGDPNICQGKTRKMPEALKQHDWFSEASVPTSETLVVFFYGVSGDVKKRALAREVMWTQFPSVPFYFVYGTPYFVPDINKTVKANDEKRAQAEKARTIVAEEILAFGDSVVGDFPELYENLPTKTLFMISEATQLCPSQKFMLKHDIDNVTNFSLLISRLDKLVAKNASRGWYIGSKYFNMPAIRDAKHKNFESLEQYPFKTFVSYCAGPAYVLSMDVAKKISELERYPFLMPRNEDAFVGHLVHLVGEKPTAILNGFPLTSYLTKDYSSKEFVDVPCQLLMTLHSIKEEPQLRALYAHLKNCREEPVVDYSDDASVEAWKTAEKAFKKAVKDKGLAAAATEFSKL